MEELVEGDLETPNVKSKEEPFILLKEDDPDLAKIWYYFRAYQFNPLYLQKRDFYGIENLPRHLFMVRNEQHKRTIYLISEALRQVLAKGNVEKLNVHSPPFSLILVLKLHNF